MPLRVFKCPVCNKITETLKKSIPKCNHNQDEVGTPLPVVNMREVIKSPNGKFMVAANKATGTSKLKDSDKILLERARNHNRDVLIDDNISLNKENKLGTAQNLLNKNGQRRRKIDDI